MEELGEKVREEKSEQERREALGDNDEDAEEGSANSKEKKGDTVEEAESGAEDEAKETIPAKKLDPSAKSFEPSPLIQQTNALDTASPLPQASTSSSLPKQASLPDVVSEAAPAMEVDEDREVVMELLDEEKRKEKAKKDRERDGKRDRGDREEGEEEEGDGEDTEMKEG